MNWDDLHLVLTISESGGLNAAARKLGVNHSTVFRRLRAVEERMATRLFERLGEGYRPTAAGQEMADAARRVRDIADGLERRLQGADTQLSGTLSVTLPDSLGIGFLSPALAAFSRDHPGVILETIIDNGFFNLTRREADVAIRPTRSPPENLVGRRVAEVAFAVYGREDRGPDSTDPAHWTWLTQDDQMAHLASARWLRRELPAAQIAMRSNSYALLAEAVEGGAGVAWLPCFLGDARSGLVRLMEPEPELATDLWLLTHEDLRSNARVSAFMAFMADHLRKQSALLSGLTVS